MVTVFAMQCIEDGFNFVDDSICTLQTSTIAVILNAPLTESYFVDPKAAALSTPSNPAPF